VGWDVYPEGVVSCLFCLFLSFCGMDWNGLGLRLAWAVMLDVHGDDCLVISVISYTIPPSLGLGLRSRP
jgi:hypothetical protein